MELQLPCAELHDDKDLPDTNRLPEEWAEPYPVVIFLWWQVQELKSIVLPYILASIRVK